MRQVGPPSPFESSDAAYSCTSHADRLERATRPRVSVGDHDHARPHRQHVAADRLVLVGDRSGTRRMPRSSSSSSSGTGASGSKTTARLSATGETDGEQVQHVSRAAVVRQVAALERRALAREEVGELPMRLGVRAVAAPGRQRADRPARRGRRRPHAPRRSGAPATGTPAASHAAASRSGSPWRCGLAICSMIVPAPVTKTGSYAKTASTSPAGAGATTTSQPSPSSSSQNASCCRCEEHGIGLAPARGREVALERRRRDEDAPERRGHRADADSRRSSTGLLDTPVRLVHRGGIAAPGPPVAAES